MKKKYWIILILIFIMQAVLWTPYLQEPLERDEGAYAYIAQRLSAGEVPYRDIYDHKPPAVYFIYAGIFRLLGESILSIRIFTLFISLITTLFIFAIGYLLWGGTGGLLSALLYAFFSSGPYIQGTSANTETFMVLALVVALYCFLAGNIKEYQGKSGKIRIGLIFLAGLFSGLAVMTKQVAVLNFIPLFGFVVIKERKALPALITGFLAFPIFFTLYFWHKGALPDFMDVMVLENLTYVGGKVFLWARFFSIVLRENLMLWALALVSFIYILARDRKFENLLLVGWGILSVVGVCAGRSFYGHYFIQAIPGLAVLSAYILLKLNAKSRNIFAAAGIAIALLALAYPAMASRMQFHFLSPDEISAKKYHTLNFVLAKEVAHYLEQNTSINDTIYVWGAEPEVYFYSRRRSASKYITFYPMFMRGGRTQEIGLQIMKDIKRDQPQYVVLTNPKITYGALYKYLEAEYRLDRDYYNWQIWEVVR